MRSLAELAVGGTEKVEEMLQDCGGLLVAPGDAAAYGAAIGELLDDPARCRSMGAAGRAWVELTWRWDLLTKGLQELLSPPAPAP